MLHTKPEKLSRKVIYESPWVNLYLDKVRFPNGRVIEEYHLLDFQTAAVEILIENAAGELIMARIPRYTTGLAEWELPAGGLDPGEGIIEAARRESLEETGYLTHGHRLIYSYYPMNGNANKLFHIVHCTAGDLVQGIDQDEVLETGWFTRDAILELIKNQAITDGFTLTGLLLWLSGAWSPQR